MASVARENVRDSRETRSQEARKKYQEPRMIEYGIKTRSKVGKISFVDGWDSASEALRYFIFERGEEFTEWDQVIEALKEEVERAETVEEQKKLLKEELKMVRQELLEEERAKNKRRIGERRTGGIYAEIVCYRYYNKGHVARNCNREIRLNDSSKNTFSYSRVNSINKELEGKGVSEDKKGRITFSSEKEK